MQVAVLVLEIDGRYFTEISDFLNPSDAQPAPVPMEHLAVRYDFGQLLRPLASL